MLIIIFEHPTQMLFGFRVTVTLTYFFQIIVSGAFLILFDVCMQLGMTSVAYNPWVTVTLTSDLVSRIGIESAANLLHSLR